MRRSFLIATAIAGLGAAHSSRANIVDFQIVEHEVVVNRAMETATFTLRFDHAPDFSKLPADGQVDAFQYEIDADTNTFDRDIEWSDIDTVIRGAEIADENAIPVRDRSGDGGDNSGGWGPVRALLPFELDGPKLTFTTGLSAIGDDDGRFRYRLFTTSQGELTGTSTGAVVPLPAAVWTGLTMLGGIGVVGKMRKRRR